MEMPHRTTGAATLIARAQRFPIQAALRYRVRGERIWHEGTIENISISGLLFKAERMLESNTPIEVSFILPGMLAGERSARVVGRGAIIRSPAHQGAPGTIVMAATLTHSRLLRG